MRTPKKVTYLPEHIKRTSNQKLPFEPFKKYVYALLPVSLFSNTAINNEEQKNHSVN